MKKIYILIITALFTLNTYSYSQSFIDTVYSFTPGTGQNNGQDSIYFPNNIFDAPSEIATKTIPETRPEHILSIGMGGEIIVGFKNKLVFDGPGKDFTIFENAFEITGIKKIFAEPALVSVSKDGLNWFTFPCDTLTLEGCAGVSPTNGKANPFDPSKSGGDTFDLADLGIDSIKYIKITDITYKIAENPNHPFYDPTLSGFDLDAVAGINLSNESTSVDAKIHLAKPTINISNDYIVINIPIDYSQIRIYNTLGILMFNESIYENLYIPCSFFPKGTYIAVFLNRNASETVKFLIN